MWFTGSPDTIVSPSLLPGPRRGRICCLAPSPDGKMLAVLRDSGELQVWSGGPHHLLLGATRTFRALALELAGHQGASHGGSGRLLEAPGHRVPALVWRPDSCGLCAYEPPLHHPAGADGGPSLAASTSAAASPGGGRVAAHGGVGFYAVTVKCEQPVLELPLAGYVEQQEDWRGTGADHDGGGGGSGGGGAALGAQSTAPPSVVVRPRFVLLSSSRAASKAARQLEALDPMSAVGQATSRPAPSVGAPGSALAAAAAAAAAGAGAAAAAAATAAGGGAGRGSSLSRWRAVLPGEPSALTAATSSGGGGAWADGLLAAHYGARGGAAAKIASGGGGGAMFVAVEAASGAGAATGGPDDGAGAEAVGAVLVDVLEGRLLATLPPFCPPSDDSGSRAPPFAPPIRSLCCAAGLALGGGSGDALVVAAVHDDGRAVVAVLADPAAHPVSSAQPPQAMGGAPCNDPSAGTKAGSVQS